MQRKLTFAALAAMALLTAPLAHAELVAGQLLAPAFDGTDSILEAGRPVLPSPVVDLGHDLVELLRVLTNQMIVGAANGDAGTELGTPDQVGIVTTPRTLANGVVVPGQSATVPTTTANVDTPAVSRTVTTPAVGVPAQDVTTYPYSVHIVAPSVSTPAIDVHTYPYTYSTPPVIAPPVTVATPPVHRDPATVVLDVSHTDVTVQRLKGTVYAGPASIPYDVGPFTAGQSNLPAVVPRQASVPVAGADVPARTLVNQPGQILVGSQTVTVPGQNVHVLNGQQVFPGADLGTITVPGQHVHTDAVPVVPAQQQTATVPAQHVGSVTVPGTTVSTPPVTVTDQQIGLPGQSVIADPFGNVDNFGYYGYGRNGDSSLYPFACLPFTNCVQSQSLAGGWVRYADGLLDSAAATANGPLVLRPL